MLSLILCLCFTHHGDKAMFDLAKNNRMAALSTQYKKVPFGSLTPYILDNNGNPVIFISTMAVHTKNINKNPSCSLMIWKLDNEDLFNSSRITFLGKMIKVNDKEFATLAKQFLKKHPEAKDFIDFEDFAFYRLEIEQIYYIGGFGDIQWINIKDYQKGFN